MRAGQSLPEFFSDVRHERMQQSQRLFQHRQQACACGSSLRRSLLCADVCLGQFNVPIAEVVPEKVIKGLHGLVKLVTAQRFMHVTSCFVKARENPAIMQSDSGGGSQGVGLDCRTLGIHKRKTRGVPNLVSEVAIRLDLLVIPADISTTY